ncbi:CinA family nicotinamide mononucleotide deamidase-related protein [Desulfosediminicola flagellatus]|uniref:CinA family nicotinamide mononucleotide deamidase-related protein n=1 Tax=Desulfosediminicola flagellatus TaxID=2569541 RepID=UPI0010AD1380|nr:CinA family nicotinamide mononucleotide deamidase-related protein [Desulfosediminicola flagellatus]
MKVEIIAIGDELTSGRILNTTSSFAARHFFEAGYEIYAMHTIGDTPELIGEALKRAIGRVDAVIVTGGLGMTDDDMTNEAVSKALNRPTMPNLEVLSNVRQHLQDISNGPVGQIEKLAWLPEGAEVLNPTSRMAGYMLVHDNTPVYFLPGIPVQMKQLLIEHVLPGLATWNADHAVSTYQRIFRIFNLPESEVNRLIKTLDLPPATQIGYYPVFPEVHLSLTIRDKAADNAKRLFKSCSQAIDTVLGDSIYGHDRDNMETIVGNLLIQKGLTLAVAESCSGGLIAQRITNIAGSSAYFLGGVVSYANSMKIEYLGVSPKLIEDQGAVCRDVAEAMATGIRDRSGADIGLAVTGIAGPEGGTDTKPVGTVYIGIATPAGNWVSKFKFEGDRLQIRDMTAQTGLDLIRKYLLQS